MSKCRFCESPATHVCTWAVRGEISIQARKLEPGMHLPWFGRPAVCDLVTLSSDRRYVYLRVDGVMCTRAADESVRIIGLRPCGAWCCDAHVREPWAGIAYCQEHWSPFPLTEECEIERARRTR